jgi:hypothetical protein
MPMSRHRKILLFALLAAASLCGPLSAAPFLLPIAGLPILPPPPPPPPPPPTNLVTYTGFVVTDVRLNGVLYHDAQVYLYFVGNKSDIFAFNVNQGGGNGSGWEITKGTASLKIISGSQTITANFVAPSHIIVSVDQANGGFGFGSMFGTVLEPAYPLGMDGTVPNIEGLNDLVTPVVQSGRAWSCIGFPVAVPGASGHCGNADAYPLATDHGPFVIYMPYYATDASGKIVDDYEGAINNAMFTIQVP